MSRRSTVTGVSLAALVAMAVTAGMATATATPAVKATATAAQAQPWDAYNESPASRTVAPVKVYRTTGTVKNANGLLNGQTATITGKDSSITLDFGKEVGGITSVAFGKTQAAGQQLGLAYSESNQYVGETSDASNGGSGSDGALTADVTAGGTYTTPSESQRGGFRYLTLFADSTGTISLTKVSLAITFDPTATDLRDYDNYFYSSDPLLNRIWYAGAYTVQTNTIAPTTGRVWGPPATGWSNSGVVGTGATVLVDGAKRDRTVWPGDLGVSVPTEFASLGDLTPTRNALTTLYSHQAATGELPFAGPEVNFYGSDTYHLWTLIGTANYYQYSHDQAWLTTEWANYQKALAFSLAKLTPDGLMNVTGTADWARGDQGGENIEANALLYQALITGAQLATVEGDTASAAAWNTQAATIKTAVNNLLWDDAAGQYRDNPTSTLYPQDGNSLAVWYGLAPADRAARVSAGLTTNWNTFGATTPEKGSEISTFPGSLEVQAHLQSGDTTAALELIRREWGYMLNSPLGTGSTFWEGYLANGQFGYGGAYMSASHGWATGPTSALTFDVLGIQPTTITGGYDIKPSPGDLSSTQGSLETPFGDIKLSWRHDQNNRTFTEQLTAPTAAIAHVDVPTFGAPTAVTVNGKVAWNGTSQAYGAHLEGDYVVLTGVPGTATIASTPAGTIHTTLSVKATTTTNVPILAGQTVTIPVTVSATGQKVVSGTVSAAVPAGWTATSAPYSIDTRNGPGSTVVKLSVHASKTVTGGSYNITVNATGGALRATTTISTLAFGVFADGTTATASSSHASNVYNGAIRTYTADNAIDQDFSTFWNDDTSGAFPDVLTVTQPAATSLNGVGFGSMPDGVPTDFVISTWDGTKWVDQVTVTGNTQQYRWIPFPAAVTTSQVRVTITADQTQNGDYSRISELTR